MTVQPNGTHAKEIALHFLKASNQPLTKSNVAKTIKHVMSTLGNGYTRDEVFLVMDNVFEVRKVKTVHSFGYIVSCLDQVLEEKRAAEQAVIILAASEQAISKQRDEVKEDDSTERNQQKAARTQLQSRLRKKFNFDMFEEQ